MPRVFISFANEDRSVAEAVKRIIEHDLRLPAGDVFIITDRSQVIAGADWLRKIREALTSVEVVILMMSARAVTRPWVNFEAGAAWLADKHVIPVCYGNMMKGKLPAPYSTLQALNLPWEEEYLVSSVAERLGVRYLPNSIKEAVRDPQTETEAHGIIRQLLRPNLSDVLKGFRDEQSRAK